MTHFPAALFDILNVSFVCTNLHFTFNIFPIQTSTLLSVSTRTIANTPPSSSSDEDVKKVDHDVRRLTILFSKEFTDIQFIRHWETPSYRMGFIRGLDYVFGSAFPLKRVVVQRNGIGGAEQETYENAESDIQAALSRCRS